MLVAEQDACWRRDRNDGTALRYLSKDQVNQSTTSAKVFALPSEMLKSLAIGPERDRPLSIDIATLAKRGRFKVHSALRNSPVRAPLDSLVLDDLDPIPVGV
jgi:hypothetical protein